MGGDRETYLLAFQLRRLMRVAMTSDDPDAAVALKHADRTLYALGLFMMQPFDMRDETDLGP